METETSDTRNAQGSGSYRLTHVLKGHTQDVKAVYATYLPPSSPSQDKQEQGTELLLSASRDETGRAWSRAPGFPAGPSAGSSAGSSAGFTGKGQPETGPFESFGTYEGKRYANAVAFVPPCALIPDGQIALAGLDTQIRLFHPSRPDKPVQILSDHWDNVCVLSVWTPPEDDLPLERKKGGERTPLMSSGSWDRTARIWELCDHSSASSSSGSGTASSSSSTSFAAKEHAQPGGAVSCSWRVKETLKGHEQAVWGVAIVKPGVYLTASADLFIRLFHGEELHTVYAGHTDVVRSLVLLPVLPFTNNVAQADSPPELPSQTDSCSLAKPRFLPSEQLFASSSNDCTIKIWSLDPRRSPTRGNGEPPLRTLEGHTSMVYSLAVLPARVPGGTTGEREEEEEEEEEEGEGQGHGLVSAGEDGTVRIWDWVAGTLLTTIPQPVISVWSVSVLPFSGDIVTGSNDAVVRVYSARRGSRLSGESREGEGEGEGEGQGTLTKEELDEHERRCEQVAETVRKTQGPRSEIVVSSQSSQEPAQDTAPAQRPDQDQLGQGQEGTGEQWHEGQRYDQILHVDVEDGIEPLPLGVNRRDDPRTTARAFLRAHNLPESYEEEIVNFILMMLA